jgi:hypothetical protein
MANLKPRVQVLLSAEVHAIYTDAAAVFGISASKLAGEVLTEAAHSVKAMAAAVLIAKEDQSDAGLRAVETMKALLVDTRQKASDAQLDLEDVISATKAKAKAKA